MSRLSSNLSANPLWNLPITDSRCVNASCFEFIYGYLEDQYVYSNYNFPLYAQYVVYFYAATLIIFCLLYLSRRLSDRGRRTRLKGKCRAYWRMLNYRRLSGKLGDLIDLSYGQLSLFAIATIFISILPFFQGYFFRDLFRFGSPPLSVRCAMLISALMPICVALAGKVNIISLLTGISYAKLNVWHRYVAYVVYALAIVHMVPHLIAPVREGGLAELGSLFYHEQRELSGSVLMFTFTLLVFSALPYFRNKIYELFKFGHIVLAIAFCCFLFWHIAGEYITPEYFYATVAILVANFLTRAVYRNRVPLTLNEFVQGFPTYLEVLPGGVTRVVVQCPQQLKWRPGQHCFISIPGISLLQSHPFTIVSLSWPISLHGRNELVLLVRACKGFTKTVSELAINSSRKMSTQSIDPLTAIAEAQKLHITTRSWIDGPYGDFHPSLDQKYHGVVCVSGGSGITASLPWVVYLAAKMRSAAHSPPTAAREKVCKTRSVHLIWSVRSVDWIRWAERELTEALHDVMRANKPLPGMQSLDPNVPGRVISKGRLKISIFVTRRDVDEVEMKMGGLDLLLGAGVEVDNPFVQVEVICGRPKYSTLLPGMMDKKRNILLACGPQGQKIDLANAVANLQSMVIENKAKEIALHTETFGW